MENEDNRAFQLEHKYITYSFSDGCIWSASTEFQSNVLQSFKSLRQRPDFSDVTLVADDGPQRIEALKTTDHKKRFSNTMNAVDDVKDKSQIWRKNKLLEQKLLAPKEKGWSCNTCGKLLGKKLKMKNHVEIHNRNFIHVCTFCEKEFGTSNGLQLHVYSKDRDNSTASPELKEKVHSTEV